MHKLNFNHPVKELIWTSALNNTYGTAKLTLNGHDRFSAQEEEYFQLRQPYQYHTAIPHQNLPLAIRYSGGNSSKFIDIFTGTNADHSTTITAMDQDDIIIDSNRVMVSQKVAMPLIYQGVTAEELDGMTTVTANDVISF